ncbi:LysR family transcriptional regulator [Stenotrophomonas maltophilia]|uniref:LysR family transcriptional regulator n=1 Tax=Stenotrophomonas TaxID=40323 RepID=UPI00066ADB8A|nr:MULTISPECIES: LysR family transcriptional regulator [Stenotrophomonas]MPS47259.1 LysR family transcriptional regulator [Stenotrophomonas sp.]ELC7364112.1 LysR family transcriptional regulator [Stenotrophomonas maltophilia]MBA0250763.1 LysR family transcriptional regulator [Stenotrophomonas maltophilia]MBA0318033.1 LysR family transcriptional regulator [Stenotrophomonas maltophilia]MBA0383717.1 LysR family transcriptional regulator [Stenotrophomonas maltophilia]
MRMDIADLRLFLAIAEAGSITAGAAQANLALASASERLRTIEADAGTPLLNRHPRGVSLTEAGAALAHHARLILQQQTQLRSELQAFAHGARGTLHLYANTAALTNYLPSRLAPWLAERPRLHVELLERTSPEVVRAISAGQAEAGIISDAVDAAGLQQHVVAEDPLVMLLPADHRLASKRSVTFADVVGETFVALADGNALQTYIEDQARDIGRRLDVRIRMKTFEGVCIMVGHGIGVGIVPRTIAHQHRRSTHTVGIGLSDAWAQRRLCACFAEWAQLSPAMRSLLHHLGVQPQKKV